MVSLTNRKNALIRQVKNKKGISKHLKHLFSSYIKIGSEDVIRTHDPSGMNRML